MVKHIEDIQQFNFNRFLFAADMDSDSKTKMLF